MPTPPLQRQLTGNPGSTDTRASKVPCLVSPTVSFKGPSQQRDSTSGFTPPSSGTAKRHRLDSSDSELYDSRHKRLRTEKQSLPDSSPTPLLNLQTPTASSCLPWASDVSVEQQDYQEQASTPFMFCDVGSTVSVSSALQSTHKPSQALSGPDPFDDPELEQFMEQISDDLMTSVFPSQANQDDTEDTFSLADFDEETMTELLSGSSGQRTQRPPSSVVRAYDRDSRSADEFDTNLQHSSPSASLELAVPVKDDSPLEQDVDWGHVHESAQRLPTANSPAGPEETRTLHRVGSQTTQRAYFHILQAPATSKTSTPTPSITPLLLKPHKTFFHIQEMLAAKVDMFKNQPEAVFELFARVVYSSRENLYHKQHFQFRSLFKESPPYPNGILIG
ncbi:hypothetical protein G7Z17_g12421 [Cylindrodendrum hubeiense]|uniref:Uncharacterized protein n=1 Tax=Cylindrodendrum hubeiense TaxID=595255 RepID=A0A9P5GVK3_9HYPO|nr:hypothetical protein G7Z17_g12421 [Cylindrodendrum hubeiense]